MFALTIERVLLKSTRGGLMSKCGLGEIRGALAFRAKYEESTTDFVVSIDEDMQCWIV